MTMDASWSRRWCVSVAAAASLAAGIAACGDGGGSEKAASTDGGASVTQPAPSAPADGDSKGSPKRLADKRIASSPSRSSDAGPDGSGKSGDSDGGNGFVKRPADPAAGPERAATDAVARTYEAFAAGDARGVCEMMSKAAREQMAEHGSSGGNAAERSTCEVSLESFFAAARRSGSLKQAFKATVGKAEIDGSKALVTVTLGGRSGKVQLVSEGGRWRFGTPGITPPPGR